MAYFTNSNEKILRVNQSMDQGKLFMYVTANGMAQLMNIKIASSCIPAFLV